MPRYEYKVVPAPTKGLKGKGIKGPEARFSHAIQELMNGLSGYGWEYQRAETLPSIERAGLTGSSTEWRNVLVFRRLRESDAEAFSPELLPAPEDADTSDGDETENPSEIDAAEAQSDAQPEADLEEASDADTAEDRGKDKAPDNGVEDTSEVSGIGGALKTLAAKRKFGKSKD